MTENESRPGPASTGGHQPPQHQPPQHPQAPHPQAQHFAGPPPTTPPQYYPGQSGQNPLFQPTPAKPKRGGRFAVMVSATALAAALIGGAGGAALVGLGSTTADGGGGALGSATAQTVSNSTATDVSGIVKKVLPSVVQVNVTTQRGKAIGSGVILSADGKILTNAHVVDGATGDVTITLADGKQYQASVLGADTKADIAVLQAKNASGLTPAKLGDSSKLPVGAAVVAIGSPGGLQNTVTTGIVSALNRKLSDLNTGEQQESPYNRTGNTGISSEAGPSYTAIQTDAAINQGNSGGPLVNSAGEIVGINSALYNPTSSGSIGIGFAIPINDAKTIISQITGG